jgi:hypothetical protein
MTLGLGGALLGALALAPFAEAPVEVTLVAASDDAERIAAELTPQLREAGLAPEFRRCDDFSCTHAPRRGDGLGVVVVVASEGDDGLLVVVHDDPRDVIVDELPVAVPRTPLEAEALGFAVLRGLTDPPTRLRTDWSVAESMGLHRAPPPAPGVLGSDVDPSEPSARRSAAAFRRGPFLDLMAGTGSSMYGGMPLGIAATLGGGFLLEGRRAPHFRVALGARGTIFSRIGEDSYGHFSAEARVGLGLATSRVLALAHLGVGPGVPFGRYVGTPELGAATSLAGSVRGRLTKTLAVGLEAGIMVDLVGLSPIAYCLVGATWTWDVPRRGEVVR